ncbi:MAG: hypothetical protein ACI4RG_05635 [Huintestinicola sp.]
MTAILIAAGCYTICALADKYAVAKAKLNGTEFTFIMSFATSIFMTLLLPFIDHNITFSWQSLIFIALIAVNKAAEFLLATLILREMSAFELKAWLGIVMFASYFVDMLYGSSFKLLCLVCIAVTGVGLFLIAKSNGQQVHYKKIALPLIGYLITRLSYGIIMRFGAVYMPSSMILYFALILMTIVLLPKIKIKKLLTENKKGTLVTAVTKLPNAIGLIAENVAVAVSLTGSSLIAPIILIALFFIGIIRKESCTKLNLAGGIISILGIVAFQLVSSFM